MSIFCKITVYETLNYLNHKGFFTTGKDPLFRIWHEICSFSTLSSMYFPFHVFYLFWPEFQCWVWCWRNTHLAQHITWCVESLYWKSIFIRVKNQDLENSLVELVLFVLLILQFTNLKLLTMIRKRGKR